MSKMSKQRLISKCILCGEGRREIKKGSSYRKFELPGDRIPADNTYHMYFHRKN